MGSSTCPPRENAYGFVQDFIPGFKRSVQTPNLVRETCFLFDLHTLSIISLFLLSFYISITNITCKPETWSTFLDHTLSSVQSLGRV